MNISNEKFCKIYSSYYGEEIDNIEQLKLVSFTKGIDLIDFMEFAIRQIRPQKTKDQISKELGWDDYDHMLTNENNIDISHKDAIDLLFESYQHSKPF